MSSKYNFLDIVELIAFLSRRGFQTSAIIRILWYLRETTVWRTIEDAVRMQYHYSESDVHVNLRKEIDPATFKECVQDAHHQGISL